MGARCYAFKTINMAACMFGDDFGLMLFKNREIFLDEPKTGRIYEVSPTTFRYFGEENNPTTEWVSEVPVAVDPYQAETISIEQSMKAGVQFLCFKENYAENLKTDIDLLDVQLLLDQGVLVHENYERGINPVIFSRQENRAASLTPRPS